MIPFHETRRGQRFFDVQLPKLITALADIADSLKAPRPVYQLRAEVPENFLSDLYLGNYAPFEQPATDLEKALTPEIVAIQERLRNAVSEDAWALVEQYSGLLAASRTAGQEQAFAAGFRSAMTMLAAGLAQPMTAEKEGAALGDPRANQQINSILQLDLDTITFADIHWRYGTFQPYSTGSGRDKKYFSRSGVATPIGDIQEDLWYQVAEHIAKREGEEWLVDALTQWNKEHNYMHLHPTELREDALQSYASRIFDNPKWVSYIPFNRQFRPEVLESARLVTIVTDCCKISGEVTQEQIDGAQQGEVSCPHCGCWSTFSILSEEIPPWDAD